MPRETPPDRPRRRPRRRPRLAPILCLALLAVAGATPSTADKPNILLVLADDLGLEHFAPMGVGSQPAPTPNLDALAAGGLLFTHAWSTPACAPTRASVLTGRHGFRTGLGTTTDDVALPPSEITLPEALEGYATAAFGKWHLGTLPEQGGTSAPNVAGFDHFSGMFFSRQPHRGLRYYDYVWTVDGVDEPGGTYTTTRLTDEVLAWTAEQTAPWFVYLAEFAPHSPYEFPPDELHSQDTTDPGPIDRYHALIEALDAELGRLVDGLPADTWILFASDNGSPNHMELPPVPDPPDPLMRAKMTVYEGGVRVPMFVTGPGVPAGVVEHPVNLTDLFATVLELGESPLPAVSLDSVSLVPYFADPARPSLRPFNYTERFHPNRPLGANEKTMFSLAAYDGRYKVVNNHGEAVPPDSLVPGPAMYDLAVDPFEADDLLQRPLTPEEQQALDELLAFLQGHVKAE